MSNKESKHIFVIRHNGEIKWYRSEWDLWVLDVNKWRDEYIENGYDVPEFSDKYRFGIHSINQDTAEAFLNAISEQEVPRDLLSFELVKRLSSPCSWEDLEDLFPIMFVNFDDRTVGAFNREGIQMERYIPDGWKGEFIDFATEYSEEVFPSAEKFWVKGDSDLLKMMFMK